MTSWVDVTAMLALELLAIAAVRTDDLRSLAVVSEAWQDQGYGLDTLADTLPGPRDLAWAKIERARYRRHRGKLKEQAQGLMRGINLLIDVGILGERTINLARWPRDTVDSRALGLALLDADEWRIPAVLSVHGVAVIPQKKADN